MEKRCCSSIFFLMLKRPKWNVNHVHCVRLEEDISEAKKKCKIWMTQPSEAQFKVSSLDLYSLARPMVWYCAVQRNSVTEVGIIAVLLPKVFGVTLLSRWQRGREAAFTPTPKALNQAQRFGQTWARQTREDYMSGSFSVPESLSSQ